MKNKKRLFWLSGGMLVFLVAAYFGVQAMRPGPEPLPPEGDRLVTEEPGEPNALDPNPPSPR